MVWGLFLVLMRASDGKTESGQERTSSAKTRVLAIQSFPRFAKIRRADYERKHIFDQRHDQRQKYYRSGALSLFLGPSFQPIAVPFPCSLSVVFLSFCASGALLLNGCASRIQTKKSACPLLLIQAPHHPVTSVSVLSYNKH